MKEIDDGFCELYGDVEVQVSSAIDTTIIDYSSKHNDSNEERVNCNSNSIEDEKLLKEKDEDELMISENDEDEYVKHNGSIGERQPSMDLRRPQDRDSDVVIQISVNDKKECLEEQYRSDNSKNGGSGMDLSKQVLSDDSMDENRSQFHEAYVKDVGTWSLKRWDYEEVNGCCVKTPKISTSMGANGNHTLCWTYSSHQSDCGFGIDFSNDRCGESNESSDGVIGGPSTAAQRAAQSSSLGAPAAQSNPFGTPTIDTHLSYGTIIAAAIFPGGVTFGSDSRQSNVVEERLLEYKDSGAVKVREVSHRIYLLLAGDKNHAMDVLEAVTSIVQLDPHIPSRALCDMVKQKESLKTHDSELIICGIEPNGVAFLKVILKDRNYCDCAYVVAGSGAVDQVIDHMEKVKVEGFTIAKAERAVLECILKAISIIPSCGGMVNMYTFDQTFLHDISVKAENVPHYWFMDEWKDRPLYAVPPQPSQHPYSDSWLSINYPHT